MLINILYSEVSLVCCFPFYLFVCLHVICFPVSCILLLSLEIYVYYLTDRLFRWIVVVNKADFDHIPGIPHINPNQGHITAGSTIGDRERAVMWKQWIHKPVVLPNRTGMQRTMING